MSRRRVLAIAIRIVRQFRRDPRTLVLMLVVPVLVLLLLAYIYRGVSHTVTLAVVNQGTSPLAAQIIQGLESDHSLAVKPMDAGAARRAIDRRQVDAVLTLPANLSISPGQPQSIQVTLEGSQPSISGSVLNALNRTLPDTIIRAFSPGRPAAHDRPGLPTRRTAIRSARLLCARVHRILRVLLRLPADVRLVPA